MTKGFYNPRFSFSDFDDTEENDEKIFMLNLSKFHRDNREKKSKIFLTELEENAED